MVVVALERLLGAPVAEAEAQLLGPTTPGVHSTSATALAKGTNGKMSHLKISTSYIGKVTISDFSLFVDEAGRCNQNIT